jgi:hypothetical protein
VLFVAVGRSFSLNILLKIYCVICRCWKILFLERFTKDLLSVLSAAVGRSFSFNILLKIHCVNCWITNAVKNIKNILEIIWGRDPSFFIQLGRFEDLIAITGCFSQKLRCFIVNTSLGKLQ